MNEDQEGATRSVSLPQFDTSSHEDFYEYYKKQSLSPKTMQRFGDIAEVVLRVRDSGGGAF